MHTLIKRRVLSRLAVVADSDWWSQLSKEDQKQYIKDHPHSKYADSVKEKDEVKQGKKPAVHHVVHHAKKLHHQLKQKHAALVKSEHEFFDREEQKPGSKSRRALGSLVKDKAKGLLKSLKHEAHEYHTSVKALANMTKGKKPSEHEIQALKASARNLALFSASLALTGGVGGGVAEIAHHLGTHFLQDLAIQHGLRASIFASVEEAGKADDDKLMAAFIEAFAKYVASADIPDSKWKSMFEAERSKIEKKLKQLNH